jgi:hypothetical protein
MFNGPVAAQGSEARVPLLSIRPKHIENKLLQSRLLFTNSIIKGRQYMNALIYQDLCAMERVGVDRRRR